MVRIVIGSAAAAVAMFFLGFLFFGSPLARIAYAYTDDSQSAAVQQAMAANLPHTGHYLIPNPNSANGTVLFGKGPVAIVDYDSGGYPVVNGSGLIGDLILQFVVALMIGLSLLMVADRVTDFSSRARLAIGLSSAGAVVVGITDPIVAHADWLYWSYATLGYIVMLGAGALILTRWFLPRPRP